MADGVLLYGDAREIVRARETLSGTLYGPTIATAEDTVDVAARVREVGPAVVVLLPGPITEHERRVATIASLRRDGFTGRILFGGSFLAEKHDALGAGADYVFDPRQIPLAKVLDRATYRPAVAVDHPWCAYLLGGEWARLERYGSTLPADPPAVLVAVTSCHPDATFWSELADFDTANAATCCIVVEDGELDENAMSSGVQPYVVLADKGLLHLHGLVRRALQEQWLARMLAP